MFLLFLAHLCLAVLIRGASDSRSAARNRPVPAADIDPVVRPELDACECSWCVGCEVRKVTGGRVHQTVMAQDNLTDQTVDPKGPIVSLVVGSGRVEGVRLRTGKAAFFRLQRVVRMYDRKRVLKTVGKETAGLLTYQGAIPWYPSQCVWRPEALPCAVPPPAEYVAVAQHVQQVLSSSPQIVSGKSVLVVGCHLACWLPRVIQHHGPAKTVRVVADAPCTGVRSGVVAPKDVEPEQYDTAFVLGGLEALGIPCDPPTSNNTQPQADRDQLLQVRSWLRPSAQSLALVAVPVGEDNLFGQSHRQYGQRGLAYLFQGWRIAASHNLNTSSIWMANRDPHTRHRGLFLVHPAPDVPLNADHRTLRESNLTGLMTGVPGMDTPLHTAVIVEPRSNPLLIKILAHHLMRLPSTAKIQVFHSRANADLIQRSFGGQIANGTLKMTHIVDQPSDCTRSWYDQLLVTKRFWDLVEGENILVFQTDSAVCSRSNQDIYNYVTWDYVGAPGAKYYLEFGVDTPHQNGGFSFRKRSKMLEAIRLFGDRWASDVQERWKFYNEDYFFCFFASSLILKAPRAVAVNFSAEMVHTKQPFAYHKPWRNKHFWAHSCTFVCMTKACPELTSIHKRTCPIYMCQKAKSKFIG